MNLFDAVSTIFFFTATADGHVDASELDVIEEWCTTRGIKSEQLGEALIALAARYENANPLTIIGDIGEATMTVAREASPAARTDLLRGLLRCVLADGVLHPNEKHTFELLAAAWQIDPVDTLRQAKSPGPGE